MSSDVSSSRETDVLPVRTFGELVGIQPIAGRFSLPGPFPPSLRLVLAAPFVPGPATRLVFYYEWQLEPGQSCRIVLGAWPRSDQPDFTRGIGNTKPYVANDYDTSAARQSADMLEIVLTEDKNELWVAAVWVEAMTEREVVSNYFLGVATDAPESDAI